MTVFFLDQGVDTPSSATPAGYAALIDRYALAVPTPQLRCAVSIKRRPAPTQGWKMFSGRYAPRHSLAGHLQFAMKWEPVELLVLAALFKVVGANKIERVVREKVTGIYMRRLWFLYEWLTETKLELADLGKLKPVPVLDPRFYMTVGSGKTSGRHRVIDNLPGTVDFCPLVRRTSALEAFGAGKFDSVGQKLFSEVRPDLAQRAAAYLLLADSKTSFAIENERVLPQRALRWGQAIGAAGTSTLSISNFERLQAIVIGDSRFTELGLRTSAGFIGVHDRQNGEPIPDHVSARAEDLQSLLAGLIAYQKDALQGGMDPVAVAAAVAFGFVYIHPLSDGNGRLHRWLIHHVLALAKFNPPNTVFPVSSAILRDLAAYRKVLESVTKPLLPLIDWRATANGNVEILNETVNFYRYFDATAHAEYLYRCIEQTIIREMPEEIKYLESFDKFNQGLSRWLDMPLNKVEVLYKVLERGNGKFSERAKKRKFAALTAKEVKRIEQLYARIAGA
jgi:hypothetical protein